jgi:hypothetical protein
VPTFYASSLAWLPLLPFLLLLSSHLPLLLPLLLPPAVLLAEPPALPRLQHLLLILG